MIQDVVLFGAGGAFKEVVDLINCINESNSKNQKKYRIVGSYDDNKNLKSKKFYGHKVLGDRNDLIKFLKKNKDVSIVVSIANPKVKEVLCEELKKYAKFETLLHPSVIVSKTAKIGPGCIIMQYSVISSDVVLDEFVYINMHTTIGHDATIDKYTSIMSHCDITGCVKIEKSVYIANSCSIVPGLKVCEGAKIHMGSRVFKNVKKNTNVIGNPAKVIKFV